MGDDKQYRPGSRGHYLERERARLVEAVGLQGLDDDEDTDDIDVNTALYGTAADMIAKLRAERDLAKAEASSMDRLADEAMAECHKMKADLAAALLDLADARHEMTSAIERAASERHVCEQAERERDAAVKALRLIERETFDAMEGAGEPEYGHYARWCAKAHEALPTPATGETKESK